MVSTLCSAHNYTREEAIERLQASKWFKASSDELQQKIVNLPEEYDGFINDLSDRTDTSIEFELIKLTELFLAETTVIPVFLVKSNFSGETYERTYVTYRRGRHHALRGLILLEKEGIITHFLVRRCSRFEVNKIVYESLGSISAPIDIRDEPQLMADYIATELAKILRVPTINTGKFIDLGSVNPDGSVADLIIGLYTTIIKTENIENFRQMLENKKYNDRGYVYSFEILPINELLGFLGKTDDAYLLSIFGRLQALNVIKL